MNVLGYGNGPVVRLTGNLEISRTRGVRRVGGKLDDFQTDSGGPQATICRIGGKLTHRQSRARILQITLEAARTTVRGRPGHAGGSTARPTAHLATARFEPPVGQVLPGSIHVRNIEDQPSPPYRGLA